MRELRSKYSLGLLCFALGIGAVLLTQRFLAKRNSPTTPPSLLAQAEPIDSPARSAGSAAAPAPSAPAQNPDPFFNGDPFEAMRKMQAQMMKELNEPLGGSLFSSWLGGRPFGGGIGVQQHIRQHEDKNFIYYDITLKNIGQENLNVKVADGQVNISGQVEKKDFSSTFHRSFPVPPDVDSGKMQMQRNGDQLTLKFPKTNASG